MATADLGGLGDKSGVPVIYSCTPAGSLPRLLPWFAILLLLLLPCNRNASAWWIWLPLFCLTGIAFGLQTAFQNNADQLEPFFEMLTSVAFALAAVWLLAPSLAKNHRIFTSLLTLLAMGFGSTLVFVVLYGADADWTAGIGMVVFLLVLVALLSLAMCLAGFFGRHRYRPLRLALGLVIWLAIPFGVLAGGFGLFISLFANNQSVFPEILLSALAMTGIGFGLLLPFLALSFGNAFYRARLKSLLHICEPPPPSQSVNQEPPLPPPAPDSIAQGK
ncbi:MAG: hypothetical protein WCO56_21520 [Verrucomicrobiota bacterium]